MVVVARLDRAIQYAAASRFYRERLWNTGSPGRGRAMTVVNVMAWVRFSNSTLADTPSRSRRGFSREGCRKRPALPEKRAWGMPGARCTRRLARNKTKNAYELVRSTGNRPASPHAMVYGLLRDLPGESGLLVTVANEIASADLTPASRRQDHTTWPSASRALVSSAIHVHRNPRRVRDDREAPLLWRGMRIDIQLICSFGKTEYFCARGWTTRSTHGKR